MHQKNIIREEIYVNRMPHSLSIVRREISEDCKKNKEKEELKQKLNLKTSRDIADN